MKKKPDFVVCGAAKSGTTALCEYLGSDPKLFMTTPKELDFFLRPRSEDDMKDYLNYFSDADDLLAGEGSVSYLSNSEHAAPQLKKNFPDVKLVFMLRNPIDRYVSDFWFYVVKGSVVNKANLFEDILFKKETLSIHDSKQDYRDYLLERGFYAKHLKVFKKYFSLSQIHIVFFEDFIKDQENTIKGIYKFLDVEYKHPDKVVKQSNKTMYPGKLMPIFVLWKNMKKFMPEKLINNKEFKDRLLGVKYLFYSDKKPELSSEARKELKSIYKSSIAELEVLLDQDLSHWKK